MVALDQLYRSSTTGKRMPLCGRPTRARYGRAAGGRCQLVVPSPGDACVVHDPEGHRLRCLAQLRAILDHQRGAAR